MIINSPQEESIHSSWVEVNLFYVFTDKREQRQSQQYMTKKKKSVAKANIMPKV